MKLTLTWVRFDPDGDGVDALYINDKLHMYGDYYHNKQFEFQTGFVDGIKYAVSSGWKAEIVEEKYYYRINFDDDKYEKSIPYKVAYNGDSPPKKLNFKRGMSKLK